VLLRMDHLTTDERATIEGLVDLPDISGAQWGLLWDVMKRASRPTRALISRG
jgi:hypothetical protein